MSKSSAERLTDVECILMHLQQTLTDLNQVVIEQGKSITKLERELKQLASDFRQVRDTNRPTRSAEDEIPPHY
ncbi:MAG: SlyX family protein [Planctomycetota bacterium]|jgi:uncharacterized coiled-coil protein SlyX